MPESRKRAAKAIDLTQFFAEPSSRPGGSAGEAKEGGPVESVERRVRSYITSRGKVTKSELYRWAVGEGIMLSLLHAAIVALVNQKMITRSFDEEKEEIVYIANR